MTKPVGFCIHASCDGLLPQGRPQAEGDMLVCAVETDWKGLCSGIAVTMPSVMMCHEVS